jgi:hypothetical protein
MTAAQKTAKDKFKKAIAYRQKTGVSLKEAFAHIYGKKVGAVKKKAAPKKKAAKNVAKKVVRKIVKKSAPKKVSKKKLTKVDYDKRYQAKKPGKRITTGKNYPYKKGNVYYETRGNRSDKGKLLGIGNVLNKNQEIKRLSQLAKTPLEKRIVSMIKYKLTGYDNLESLLKDILYSGLQSGIVSDLIYYSDTLAFYKRYKKEIDTLLKDLINETGSNSPADLFGNKWDKEDFFIEDTNNRNLLAWFGFEEKLRGLADKLGYEI